MSQDQAVSAETASKARPRARQTAPCRSWLALAAPAIALANPQKSYKPIEIIYQEQLELIHNASMRILEEVGMDVLDEDARELMAKSWGNRHSGQ